MTDQIVLNDLLRGGWKDCRFEPFRDGVDICHLVEGEPAVALLRYAPGAVVPRHRHEGLETIIVLEGGQEDEFGHYPAGSVVLNPPGSVHTVASREGCVILIQWDRPVAFLE